LPESPVVKFRHCSAEFELEVTQWPPFKINKSGKHVRSNLDTLTLAVYVSMTGKLKFLVDTTADISVIRDLSFRPGCNLELDNVIEIKGI
jgi:hypothetical protein